MLFFDSSKPPCKRYHVRSYRKPHKIMANYISDGTTILDVGCGTGALARVLERKDVKLYGVDSDRECAKMARTYYENVLICDVERCDFPFVEKSFDIIVFADVLEHLKRPDVILRKAKSLLMRNGFVLVSIPNVVNWITRLQILFGNFNYWDAGPCDKTHLRFFTKRSIIMVFESAGYLVTEIKHTVSPPSFRLKPLKRLPIQFAQYVLYNALLRFIEGWSAYQYVLKAKPKDVNTESSSNARHCT